MNQTTYNRIVNIAILLWVVLTITVISHYYLYTPDTKTTYILNDKQIINGILIFDVTEIYYYDNNISLNNTIIEVPMEYNSMQNSSFIIVTKSQNVISNIEKR